MPTKAATNPDIERPLSNEEIRKLRAIVESDERVRWFWSTVRTWAVWVSAVVLGVTVGWEALGKALKFIVGR